MKIARSKRFFLLLLGSCLIFLLAACGSGGSNTSATPTTTGNAPAGGVSATPGTTPPANGGSTAPIPPTQTSCPAAGTGRVALMPTLALGSHQNIVYIVNEYQGHTPTFGTLKRNDVSTGTKVEIVKLANTSINVAQVSSDGQWLIFVSAANGQSKLQLIRMDGGGLQTLYCGNNVYELQWSVNQKLVAFEDGSDIYLLNMINGSLQRVFHPGNTVSRGLAGYRIQSWLDATHLYLLTQPLDQPADTLSILDITRGADQDSNNLQKVLQVNQYAFCWQNDSSYDARSLFVSQCTGGDPRGGITQGPSTIVVEPPTGGTAHTIYSTATLAITNIRSITNTELFYITGNTSGDKSHNGLWKINADGTGNTFLTSASENGTNPILGLNQYTQYPWSNFSRDGSMYSLEEATVQNGNVINTLLVGSLNGGKPTMFASISGTELEIVGWTTM